MWQVFHYYGFSCYIWYQPLKKIIICFINVKSILAYDQINPTSIRFWANLFNQTKTSPPSISFGVNNSTPKFSSRKLPPGDSPTPIPSTCSYFKLPAFSACLTLSIVPWYSSCVWLPLHSWQTFKAIPRSYRQSPQKKCWNEILKTYVEI